MKILYIGHSYHKITGSSRFFIEHLESLGQVEYLWDEEWRDASKPLDLGKLDAYDLIVIWQIHYAALRVRQEHFHKTVFVPMYDGMLGVSSKNWRKLRGMRVLCFCQELYQQCLNNKVDAFLIQYFPKPQNTPFQFDELSLFFWQRHSSPNWRTLHHDLPVAQFDRIHLHGAIDPHQGEFVEPVPCEQTRFNITCSTWFAHKQDYFDALDHHNVFIAPRNAEGIGMSLLEAMQRGMVCIAHNAPTMNEYIVPHMNGYLTPSVKPIVVPRNTLMSERVLACVRAGHARYQRQLVRMTAFLKRQPKPKFRKIASPLLAKIEAWQPLRAFQPRRSAFASFRRSETSTPRLTVVTVVRNDAQGLLRTLLSVLEQTTSDFEYLIVDGQSTDATQQLLQSIPPTFARVVSEKDSGPYDAMNKAARLARGEYVMFLNAGDTLFSEDVLESIVLEDTDADILYGHHAYHPTKGAASISRAQWLPHTFEQLQRGDVSHTWLSGIPCHQSTITRRTALLAHPYDHRQFKVAADHSFLFDALSRQRTSHHLNIIIANYYGGGYSAQNLSLCVANWKEIALKHTLDSDKVFAFYKTGRF